LPGLPRTGCLFANVDTKPPRFARGGFLLCDFCPRNFPCNAQQESAVQPLGFAAYHLPALERDEVRHNLIVAVLGRMAGDKPPELQC
jgi:hypothetical protein